MALVVALRHKHGSLEKRSEREEITSSSTEQPYTGSVLDALGSLTMHNAQSAFYPLSGAGKTADNRQKGGATSRWSLPLRGRGTDRYKTPPGDKRASSNHILLTSQVCRCPLKSKVRIKQYINYSIITFLSRAACFMKLTS